MGTRKCQILKRGPTNDISHGLNLSIKYLHSFLFSPNSNNNNVVIILCAATELSATNNNIKNGNVSVTRYL